MGARVKALREAMDLSLRDLAARSGVSAPMLSQVERGETSPTLATAERIAAGLDLSLSQLLRLDERPHISVTRPATAARAGAPAISPRSSLRACPASARTYRATPWSPGPRPEPRATRRCTSRVPVRPRSSSPAPSSLLIDDERIDLDTGDSVTFDADLPHHFVNDGDVEAELLAVVASGLRRS